MSNKKEVIIEIEGKDYTFPLGIGFIGECLENLGLSTTELFEKMDANAFKWSTQMMYQSLKYKYEDSLEFTLKEFIEKLDNDPNGISKIGNFNMAFVKTLNPNLPIEKPKGKPSKKK